MIKNYLKIALRNLLKHKVYSLINIIGLAVSIACCLLLFLYVADEMSYDKFNEKYERIYRVTEERINEEGEPVRTATTFPPMATALALDYSFIEEAVRIRPSDVLVKKDDIKIQEERFFYADGNIFDVFSFDFIEKAGENVLANPYDIVITEESAKKYFGDGNPIGQTLLVAGSNKDQGFKVTGVVKDLPDNSHFHLDFLASMETIKELQPWHSGNWDYPPLYTYVLLKDVNDAQILESQMPAFATKHLSDNGEERSFHLQNIADIHLYSELEAEIEPVSNILYVYIFGVTGFFILLIACINFVNLSTARSSLRAKEVGMRKVMGAFRAQLIRQFLFESVLTALASLVLSICLIEFLLPVFNSISGKNLRVEYFSNPEMLLALAGLVLFIGIAAGSYPAFYLSAFRPVRVLKGKFTKTGSLDAFFRKGLVVFQFCISSILIIGTAVIYNQLDYIQSSNPGFKKENMVIIPLRGTKDQQDHESLKNELKQSPNVKGVTSISSIPGNVKNMYDFPVTSKKKGDSLAFLTLAVDHDFVSAFGMEVMDGRDFSKDFATDKDEGFLINESAARKFGWEEPLGMELEFDYYLDEPVRKEGKVIGVVKDYHYSSFHDEIEPVLFYISYPSYYYDYIAVSISGNDVKGTMNLLEEKWGEFNAERPFEFYFLDTKLDELYRSEQTLGNLFIYFSVLAVFIACLGLLGLISFAAERRTKEIGIRKVLGADLSNIMLLLTGDFFKLILVAFILAIPVSYFGMSRWLDNFVYKIGIGPGIFIVTGIVVFTIALLTILYQAFKAAMTNPVNSIKCE